MVNIKKEPPELKLTDYRNLIRKQATCLAEMLRQSPEYHQFQLAKQKLEADDENAAILAELRQQQMTLKMASMLGEDVRDDMGDFENMFILLSQEPSISDYLFAEGRLLRLISEVEQVFSDKLELWQLAEDDGDMQYDLNLN